MICPNCGKNSWNSSFCRHCGTPMLPKRKSRYRGLKIAIFAFSILIILSSISSISDNPKSENSSFPIKTSEPLEVLDHHITYDGSLGYVSGHIRNNTEKDYDSVIIRINLYKNDVLIETIGDFVNGLGAGETWEFNALMIEEGADSYKIIEVNGW